MKTLTTLLTGLLIATSCFAARTQVMGSLSGSQSPMLETTVSVSFSGATVDKLGDDCWSFYTSGTYIVLHFAPDTNVYESGNMLVTGTYGGVEKYRGEMARVLDVIHYEIK